MKKKVAVGLSGGVDSAVSAALLYRAGFDVIGVYLHCFPKNFQQTLNCTDKEDFKSAQEVAKTLKIPFTFYDFEKEYQEKVIDYFFNEYEAGRTPNPDAVCNKEIKFGLFLDKALKELGADYVATGHYARVFPDGDGSCRISRSGSCQASPPSDVLGRSIDLRALDGGPPRLPPLAYPARVTRRFMPNDEPLTPKPDSLNPNYHLLSGVDPTKDQSYFLYDLNREQLSRILFPVGDYTKKEVREMARKFGLPNWQRKDSQGICFLGKISVRKFLEQRIEPKKGEVVDTTGRVIGEHDGVWFYTIGQRHGFRVSSKLKAQSSKVILPLYVLDKDVENNRLVVGWGKECEKKEFAVEDANWITGEPKVRRCRVRIRHLGQLYPCQLKTNGSKVDVVLDEPAWGVASGQAAVFYQGEEVLGGGIITDK